MNNEQTFGLEIKRALDAGLRLRPEIGERLRVARERALERHWVAAEAVSSGPAIAMGPRGARDPEQSFFRTLAPALFLIVALFGIHQWQEAREIARAAAQQTEEIVDVDSRVLTSDLPIDAYLDADFKQWLEQPSE